MPPKQAQPEEDGADNDQQVDSDGDQAVENTASVVTKGKRRGRKSKTGKS